MVQAVAIPQAEDFDVIYIGRPGFEVVITADGQCYTCLECGEMLRFGKKADLIQNIVPEVKAHVCGGKKL